MFTDKVVFVETLAAYPSNSRKEVYTSFSGYQGPAGATSAIRMNIQPMNAYNAALVEGQVGKAFKGFTTVSGVTEGMRLTVSGTQQQYIVRGREAFFYGPLPHAELTLFRKDPS